MTPSTESLDHLDRFGFAMLHGVFGDHGMMSLADQLVAALQDREDPSVLRSRGRIYGSRNLIDTFPQVCEISRHPLLIEFLLSVLGPDAGLVRALYFDKPPDRSWSLPWHRDRTIAVKSNKIPSAQFCKPTLKAGIPHVEAPEFLLANMLTLRIHIDAMTPENGPLSVIPGSHLLDQQTEQPPVELHADVGDVLAMRPLLSHSSSTSRERTTSHRRVIHLEFASSAELPEGLEWHSFIQVGS